MEIGIKIALLGACSSIFLLFCWDYGNIFSGYYRFITAYFYLGLSRKKGRFKRPQVLPKYKIWLFWVLRFLNFSSHIGYYRYIKAYLLYGLSRKKGRLGRPQVVPKYKIWLFKILGGCLYCNNVYLTTGCYVIASFPKLNFIDWLLSVTLSHVLIKIHHKYFDY